MDRINPKIFGLNSKIKLYRNSDLIQIDKKRKSRIIMKDGENILKISQAIKEIYPNIKIEVLISGPICSKTLNFLKSNDLEVIRC